MDDTFVTVKARGTSEIKVRGSRFIGLAAPVLSEAQVSDVLTAVRKDWHAARHHCYAYRLGRAAEVYRSNDDGEPTGTAGAPMLQQIESRELTNTLVVVTRYFGGAKLGRGGLVRAYSEAAALALNAAGVKRHIVRAPYLVRFSYDDTAAAMSVIESVGGQVTNSEYSDATMLVVEVRLSAADTFRKRFVDELGGRGEIGPIGH